MDVHLDDFPEALQPMAWGWVEPQFKRLGDDNSPTTIDAFMAMPEGYPIVHASTIEGQLGGILIAREVVPAVFEVHLAFAPRFWGTNRPFRTLVQLIDGLFNNGARKVMAPIFSDNQAARGLALRVGAAKEGALRRHSIRGGVPVDIDLFSILAEEWHGIFSGARFAPGRTIEQQVGENGHAAVSSRELQHQHLDA
jgi:RimJ/RimL family protein N-acetyltransferase